MKIGNVVNFTTRTTSSSDESLLVVDSVRFRVILNIKVRVDLTNWLVAS